jgi:hypothetical protein
VLRATFYQWGNITWFDGRGAVFRLRRSRFRWFEHSRRMRLGTISNPRYPTGRAS